jgi:galactose mutarotase-like enzyme
MQTQITNGQITIRVNHKGAELASIFNQAVGLEYLWNADPKFWPKSSPVLFPIVGALKDGEYLFEGKSYRLPRHGFAREMEFKLESSEPSKLVFVLRSDEATLKVFPFPFELRIIYALDGFSLDVTYQVKNPSNNEMYFSIGAHPAFKVPLVDGDRYEDYFLKFDRPQNSDRWPITKDGYIGEICQPFLQGIQSLPLTHEMFYRDALVFKDLSASKISIRSHRHTHGLDFSFPGFPFFGIWAFRDADFVCLEPWCGIADSVNHDGRIENKEGIVELAANSSWERTWSVNSY